MRRSLSAGIISLCVSATGACARQAAPAAAAAAPDACAVALAEGQGQDRLAGQIERARQDARRRPNAKPALERLGYLHVSSARVTGDAGHYKLAEAVADCLQASYPGDAAALLLRGHVLHQLHRFKEAEQLARELVAKRTMALDYGLLGDALMEQGRLDEAVAAYQRMIDLKPFYQSYTRAAHVRWMKGDLDGARLAMRRAIESASPRDPESSAWAWTRVALYELQANRLADARRAADTALTFEASYAAALLARGRILLAEGNRAEALKTLTQAASLAPLPEYQWTLADALRASGRTEDAMAVERELVARGRTSDPRTLALYLATRGEDAPTALSLAEAELDVRSDVFTLDAQAWALAANGRTAEALTLINRALAAGTADARLFLHAGVIHADAGQRHEASRWLHKAARLRAMLLPSEHTLLDGQLNNRQTN
jgi:tetratricopeptide (TPR) repeat protein